MKSKLSKTNLKIAAATGVGIFSLATMFTGTLAWFSMNANVSATGMSVTVGKMSNVDILSCYAIRYDGTAGAIAFDISNGDKDIAMSEYDFVFKDRNVNTPLFIRMELANFDTSNDLTVTIPCSHYDYKTNDKVDPFLSNVVGAKLLYGLGTTGDLEADEYEWSGDNVTSAGVVNSYQGMLSHARESSGTPFVVAGEKDTTISLSLQHASVFHRDFILNKDGKDVVVVYIVLDYYVTSSVNLVTDYLNSYKVAHDENYALSFVSDISTMVLGNEGN